MEFQAVLDAINKGDASVVIQWAETPGCNVDAEVDEEHGATALQWACQVGEEEMGRVLLQKGANPNHQNAFQAGPLHWAAKKGNKVMIDMLLSYYADPLLANSSGDTPLDIARKYEHLDIQLMLESHIKDQESLSQENKTQSQYQSSVGYTHSDAAAALEVQEAQRLKTRADLGLQASKRMIDELRNRVDVLQREKIEMAGKVKTQDKIKQKCEELQKEKLDLQMQLKRRVAEDECRIRDLKNQEEMCKKEQEERHAQAKLGLEKLKLNLEDEVKQAQTEKKRAVQALEEKVDTKATEIEELKAACTSLQGDKIRLELEVEGLKPLTELNEDLQRDRALLRMEVKALNETVDSLQDDKVTMEGQLRDNNRKVEIALKAEEAMKRQVAVLEQELKEGQLLREEAAQAKQEKTRFVTRIQTLTEELERFKNLRDSSQSTSITAMDQMQHHIETLQEEKGQLRTTRAELQATVQDLQNQVTQLQKRCEDQESALQTLDRTKAELAIAKRETDAIQEQMQHGAGETGKLKSKMEELMKENAQLQSEIEALTPGKEELDSLKEEKKGLEAETKQQKLLIEELRLSADRLSQENSELEHQSRTLRDVKNALMKLEREHQHVQNEFAKARTEYQDVLSQKTLDANNAAERTALLGQLQTTEQEMLQLQQDLDTKSIELVNTKELLEEKSALCEHLKSTTKTLERQAQEDQDRLETLLAQKLDIEARSAQHDQTNQHQFSILQDKVATAKEDCAKSAVQIRDLEHQLSECKSLLDERTSTVNDLKLTVNDLKLERTMTKNQFESETEKLIKGHKKMEIELQTDADKKVETAQKDVEAMKRRLQFMHNENQALQLQVHALQDQVGNDLGASSHALYSEPPVLSASLPAPHRIAYNPIPPMDMGATGPSRARKMLPPPPGLAQSLPANAMSKAVPQFPEIKSKDFLVSMPNNLDLEHSATVGMAAAPPIEDQHIHGLIPGHMMHGAPDPHAHAHAHAHAQGIHEGHVPTAPPRRPVYRYPTVM